MKTESVVEPVYGEIGKKIRFFREKRGVTQAEMATATGLTRTSIVNIEQGRQRFMVHTLLQIASSLRVGPEELLPPNDRPRTIFEIDGFVEVQHPLVKRTIEKGIEIKERGELSNHDTSPENQRAG